MTMNNPARLEKATLYDRYRLPYAGEAVDDLLGRIGAAPMVADVGAGTGQLARLFAPRCSTVYAVEPDPAMRQVAATALAGVAGIEIVAAAAEQTTLHDQSIDLIVIGNAFHRFKPEACAELQRILRPGGWIALFTYTFLNQAYTQMLFPKLGTLPSLARRIDKAWHATPIAELFGEGQLQSFSYPQMHSQDWAAFIGAACSGIEAPEPSDPDFARFEAINLEVFEAFAVNGEFEMAYETRVTFGQPAPA
jgi:SAM-dependent methyltransferase